MINFQCWKAALVKIFLSFVWNCFSRGKFRAILSRTAISINVFEWTITNQAIQYWNRNINKNTYLMYIFLEGQWSNHVLLAAVVERNWFIESWKFLKLFALSSGSRCFQMKHAVFSHILGMTRIYEVSRSKVGNKILLLRSPGM